MAGKIGVLNSCNLATAGNWKYRAEIFRIWFSFLPESPAWSRWLRSQTGICYPGVRVEIVAP